MRALSFIFVSVIVLASIGLGTVGKADELIAALSVASAAALLSGYFVLGSSRTRFSATIPSLRQVSRNDAGAHGILRFLGRSLPGGDTDHVVFHVKPHGIEKLFSAIGFSILLAILNHGMNPQHDVAGIFVAELSTVFCLIAVVKPCFSWYAERHLLNDANAVFTANYSAAGSSLYSGTKYSFVDPSGLYRGGESRELDSSWTKGELVLVFYDKRNPDRSRANFGLRYHTLDWPAEAASAAALSQ